MPPPFSPVFISLISIFPLVPVQGFRNERNHLSMIIRDFNIFGSSVRPSEADPILIIDPNRVLAVSVPLQCFQLVVGRRLQVGQFGRPFQLFQFPPCNHPDVCGQVLRAASLSVPRHGFVRAQSRPQRANFVSVLAQLQNCTKYEKPRRRRTRRGISISVG